jgi:hypothetical protein
MLTSLAALVPTTASAQGISIGPGGVRVDTDDRRDRRIERRIESREYDRRVDDRRRGDYDRRPERCRTGIERTRNRFGEVVTRRTRVCR